MLQAQSFSEPRVCFKFFRVGLYRQFAKVLYFETNGMKLNDSALYH